MSPTIKSGTRMIARITRSATKDRFMEPVQEEWDGVTPAVFNPDVPFNGPWKPRTKKRRVSDAEKGETVESGDSSPIVENAGKLESAMKTVESSMQTATAHTLSSHFEQEYIPEFVEGLKHILQVDPSLTPIANALTTRQFRLDHISAPGNSYAGDSLYYFEKLCSSIISQQVSMAAARSIRERFVKSFDLTGEYPEGLKFPRPSEVLAADAETLRSAGLSGRKVEYVKSLAAAFENGELSHELFSSASDDEIEKELTKVKGLGVWSSDMFMMFCLRRLNVFAPGDLGIARGVSVYVSTRPHLLREAKEVEAARLEKELADPTGKKRKSRSSSSPIKKNNRKWTPIQPILTEHIADKFAPYRTIFSLVMWNLSSAALDTLDS